MSAPALPATPVSAKPIARARAEATPFDLVNGLMKGLASLKLTVALMALGILVVYIGTVAQQNADIWQVVRDYFHAWVMWVDVNLFFPKQFFWFVPTIHIPAPEALHSLNITNFHTIPMPGGLVVGTLMVINLLAAHGWRFKIQAKGGRLLAGVGVVALGMIVALVIILAGHDTQGFQSKPPFSWDTFWAAFLAGNGLIWLGLAAGYGWYGVVELSRKKAVTAIEIIISALVAAVLMALLGLLAWGAIRTVSFDLRPSNEALRIVWQLLQGSLAALVLLVGCVLVFRKRGGMVLLHAGIGLLMFNELYVAMTARERQVFLQEGQTSNYLRDIRTTELAIIDSVDEQQDHQVVVPRSRLLANLKQNVRLAKAKQPPVFLSDPKLPFDVAVVEYHTNADVRDLKPGEKTPATAGRGLKEAIVPLAAAKGTDMGGGVDLAAAYVKLAEKKTGKDLGTFLLSQLASEQQNPRRFAEKATVGDKEYSLFLRFQHEYKPFTMKLIDVRKDDYVASDTPRNYSSDIQIKDEKAGIDQTVHIKMNDPLRYRGDTFYQSGYHPLPGGKEATTLQVVLNRAWMIPYVACMAVVIGMVAHFLLTVTRFIARREEEELAAGGIIAADLADDAPLDPRGRKGKPAINRPTPPPRPIDWAYIILPFVAASVFLAYVYSAARLPQPKSAEMDLYAFGQLPVAHMGRVKPLDTLARSTVRTISGNGKETVKWDAADPKRPGKTKTVKLPAIQWLLEVASGTERSSQLQVVRIDSPEVRRLLKLEDRKGYMYSVEELKPQIGPFEKAVEAAGKLDEDDRTVEQRRLLELDQALKAYIQIVRSFSPPQLPPPPTPEEIQANPGLGQQYMAAFGEVVRRSIDEARVMKAPRVLPVEFGETKTPDDVWRPYPVAWALAFMQHQMLGEEPDPKTVAFESILSAYREGEADKFNQNVRKYQNLLDKAPPALYDANDVAQESFFNAFSPFYVGMPLYLIGFLLAILGWLLRYRPLNWAAFTMILLTLGLHTLALWWRMDISGRPPVTNLYSSAVFIGWACVLFGLIMEAIFRLGIGNVVAAVAGFATLLIAYFLGAGGDDTIGVMQAVLDTQFWLATHVVCITLGYAATYLAGLLGMMYVVFGLFTPLLDKSMRKDLGRMIYGITCFAILFSFYGTVLGGLWADDSWGRFWGWDPKENGALIIVLWNALILHARWDKMIADRGLAVLALGGNIVTSWSWFGVNQLGIGLHSYGFTNGVAMALVLFGFSQLVLIGLGCLPTRLWWSFQADGEAVRLQRA